MQKLPVEIHPYITKNGLKQQLNLEPQVIEAMGFLDGGIWFHDTLTVMCGTFPPNREYRLIKRGYLHYSSARNKYWKHWDNIYNTSLYIPSKISKNGPLRIQNALDKIKAIKKKSVGFIDIFSKIQRKISNSTKDIHLIPVETIFENGIFETVLQSSVVQFGFVYSLSRDIFCKKIEEKYHIKPQIISNYMIDKIPLEVKKLRIEGKEIYLSYAPIHGNITDERKRMALKKVFELDI